MKQLCFNTASGIRLCNSATTSEESRMLRFNTASGIRLCNSLSVMNLDTMLSFNTASGIRLCNYSLEPFVLFVDVSIPQAVFACATELRVAPD